MHNGRKYDAEMTVTAMSNTGIVNDNRENNNRGDNNRGEDDGRNALTAVIGAGCSAAKKTEGGYENRTYRCSVYSNSRDNSDYLFDDLHICFVGI